MKQILYCRKQSPDIVKFSKTEQGDYCVGEIADMIVDGGMCEWCGTVFTQDYGYPVVCSDCWNNATPEERNGRQKAFRKGD